MEKMEKTNEVTKKRNVKNIEGEEEKEQKAKRRAQIAKAARKHRQRQKEEMEMLRTKIATMEEKVNDIQSTPLENQESEAALQKEAKKQAEIRAQVDRENEFLRCSLLEQIQFTARLQQALARQPVYLNVDNNGMETPEMIAVPKRHTITDLEEKRHRLIRYGLEGIAGAKLATQSAEELLNQLKPPLDRNVELKTHYRGHQFDLNLRTILKDMDAADFAHIAFTVAQDEEFSNQFSFLSSNFAVQALDSDTALVKQTYVLDSGMNASTLAVVRKETMGKTSWIIFRSIDMESESPTKEESAIQSEYACLRVTQVKPDEDGTRNVEFVFRSQGALAMGMESEQQVKDIAENGMIFWVKALEGRARKLQDDKLFI